MCIEIFTGLKTGKEEQSSQLLFSVENGHLWIVYAWAVSIGEVGIAPNRSFQFSLILCVLVYDTCCIYVFVHSVRGYVYANMHAGSCMEASQECQAFYSTAFYVIPVRHCLSVSLDIS